MPDAASIEEAMCTCGAGHGSLEGHAHWCEWVEHKRIVQNTRPEGLIGSRRIDPVFLDGEETE